MSGARPWSWLWLWAAVSPAAVGGGDGMQSISFREIEDGAVKAVDGISFTVGAGENVPDRIDRRHKIGNGSIGDRAECVAVVECETGIRAADVAEQSQHGSPGITYAAD